MDNTLITLKHVRICVHDHTLIAINSVDGQQKRLTKAQSALAYECKQALADAKESLRMQDAELSAYFVGELQALSAKLIETLH